MFKMAIPVCGLLFEDCVHVGCMAIPLFSVVPLLHGTCFLLKLLHEGMFRNEIARLKACALGLKGEIKGDKAPLASAQEVKDEDATGGTEKRVTFEQAKGNWEVMQEPMRSTALPPPLVAQLSPR
jgi:hypothetical protein